MAGDEVSSRCLKCKDVTNHTIVAMLEEKIAKVLCNVCKARHNYRPPVAEKVASDKKRAPRKPSLKAIDNSVREAKMAADFEKMMQSRDLAKALAYAMTDTFNKNDLLNHHVFGMGVVTKKIQHNRIEVLFKEGSKVLACALPAPVQ